MRDRFAQLIALNLSSLQICVLRFTPLLLLFETLLHVDELGVARGQALTGHSEVFFTCENFEISCLQRFFEGRLRAA